MRALTIHQPWAGLIVGSYQRSHGLLRRVEVRGSAYSYVGPLLIHAGLAIDKEACKQFGIEPDKVERGKIIGSVEVAGMLPVRSEREWSHLCAVHMMRDKKRPYGEKTTLWLFSSSTALRKPIPCRGQLGLWTPPPHILRKLA